MEVAADHAWAMDADERRRRGRMGFSPCGECIAEREEKRGLPKETKKSEKGEASPELRSRNSLRKHYEPSIVSADMSRLIRV